MNPLQAGSGVELPAKVGNYRIESRLGSGGMGVVYRAFDEALQRPVAIKHLLADRSHPTASKRFRREALLAARLNHPAIVHIYDIVETAAGDWIVMELVEGQTLGTLIRDGLGVAQAVRLGREIAEGLAEAHAQGIIHRDLKTANVMVTAAGRAKILDFGLAKLALQGGDSDLSVAGTILGTCHAMSPEQVEGLPLDHRSDLFSFGSLLYEMLTGVAPFRAATIPETLARICKALPPPAHTARPEVPAELSDFLGLLLSKDPARRLQSGTEAARFLEGLERSGLVAGKGEGRPGSGGMPREDLSGEATFAEGRLARRESALRLPSLPSLPPPPSLPSILSTGAEPSRPVGERRQITVVCCEVVHGEIDAGGGEDPEVFYERMLQLRALASAVAGRYEGHLGSVLGERLLIYFGYPHTHEDNARRAVRAALDLLAEAAQATQGEASLALRVGVHTGPAVVSTSPESPQPVTLGATLDRALELQALAGAGGVVVSPATSSLLQKSFDLEAVTSGTLSGFRVVQPVESPEDSHLLSGVILPPLVGRREEMELLLSRWNLVREGRGQVVLISGEAGIGKSHLVAALRQRLSGGEARWLSCHGSPYAQSSPLQPVVSLLRRAVPLREGGSSLDQLAGFLEEHGQRDALPLLAPLLGIPLDGGAEEPAAPLPPDRQRERTLDALVALTLDMAERQPLVLAIEDLHWLDPTTLGWLDRLIDQAPTVPLLLVLTVRLQTLEVLWGPRAHLTQIALGPLTGQEAERLVERVLGGRELPEAVRRQIIARTDGVPLFLEELTKAVVESPSGQRGELPATLRDSLAARLDRLGNAAKEVAQLAAVFGRSFSLELLAAVAAWPEAALQRELRSLVQAELIHRKGVGAQTRYLFKHALVQDAAYQSLLKREQQQLHLRAAEALESRFAAAMAAQPEVLAHHYTEGNDGARAVRCWFQAAQAALGRAANLEALHHLEKGLALVPRLPAGPERDQQELGFQGSLVPAVIATQGFASPRVEQAFRRGVELCERLGAPNFQLLWGLFGYYSVCREADKAVETGAQMLALAESQGSVAHTIQSHYGLAGNAFAEGELATAREHLRLALSLEEPAADIGGIGGVGGIGGIGRTLILSFGTDDRKVAAAYRGPLLWLLGHPDPAREAIREAIAWAREEPNPFTLCTVLLLSCFLHLFLREEETVEVYAGEMMALSREHNLFQTRDAAVMLGCARAADVDGGEEALAALRQGIDAYRASGFQVFLTFYLAQLAAACLRHGRLEECAEHLQEALELSERNRERFWAAEIHRLRGDLALAQGAPREQAAAHCRRALEIARRQSAKSLELRAAVSLRHCSQHCSPP